MSIDLQILLARDGLIAINKPPGTAVHSSPGIGSSVLKELSLQTGIMGLTPVHRLDKDASGVLLFAESTAIAAEIQRTWDSAEKIYIALCEGIPNDARGVIDAPILENQSGKPERMRHALKGFALRNPGASMPPLPALKTSAVHVAGRASQTDYLLLETFGTKCSLIEARPRQGRMHQIRVHLAHLGVPLLVDAIYGKRVQYIDQGNDDFGKVISLERMPLHAARLIFAFKSERIDLAAPLPSDMNNAVRGLRDKFSVKALG